jgi:nitric oxide reductase subunit B
MGLVNAKSATRVVYLDAILYLGAGVIGTGHHWYFTGQGTLNMGLSSCFSAMEVVPLVLLTLDAWDFMRLKNQQCPECGKSFAASQKWAIYFLMAVGFWNFVGAGVFGFLINLPIVSYFEVGTTLTTNHGHAAMFGVFGLNVGLALMVVLDLFPAGVLQLWDAIANGYWHARELTYTMSGMFHTLEWVRVGADTVFLVAGVVPLVYATLRIVCSRKAVREPAPA